MIKVKDVIEFPKDMKITRHTVGRFSDGLKNVICRGTMIDTSEYWSKFRKGSNLWEVEKINKKSIRLRWGFPLPENWNHFTTVYATIHYENLLK